MPAGGEVPLIAVRLPLPDAAAAIFAEWEAGRAVMPLDPDAPDAEVARQVERLRPTQIVDTGGRHRLPDGERVSSEVAAVVATSGTTGEPRGVELTWDGLRASAASVGAALAVDPRNDRWVCCLPLHHVGGLAVLGRAWAGEVPVTVVPRLDAESVEGGGTLTSVVPTLLYRALADERRRHQLRSFRRVLVGGAPLGPETRAAAEAAAIPVVATYGLTETWGGVVHDGHPLPGVEVRIRGHEVQLRTPTAMRGYRHQPAETEAAFTADGWLRTGDAGAAGDDGRLTVTDRLRDLIISGGVSVSPNEVEAVLSGHPSIADVCVIGRPDDEWGERVVAFVATAAGHRPPSLPELRQFAASRLSAPKLPREVVSVRLIPRTSGGKPLRRLLRDGLRSPGLA